MREMAFIIDHDEDETNGYQVYQKVYVHGQLSKLVINSNVHFYELLDDSKYHFDKSDAEFALRWGQAHQNRSIGMYMQYLDEFAS